MTSITLPPNIDITDAYEEIQVLHSFRVESADGKTFLFYCDSEADKEVVVEALKVASKA
ncbi:hypothetical protein BDY24DRAFT_378203 [Mrakia frigida]|uniref:uncharacterized protein n=1 Tax=Mrakia frigida TaxID=29902 RepID=UPI003FCBFA60